MARRPDGLAKDLYPVKLFTESVVEQLGDVLRLGWLRQGAKWISCGANKHRVGVLHAGLHIAGVCLHLQGAVGLRFGNSVAGIPATVCDNTMLLRWQVGKMIRWSSCFIAGAKHISLERLTGEKNVSGR